MRSVDDIYDRIRIAQIAAQQPLTSKGQARERSTRGRLRTTVAAAASSHITIAYRSPPATHELPR